jgi:hypothetical protein
MSKSNSAAMLSENGNLIDMYWTDRCLTLVLHTELRKERKEEPGMHDRCKKHIIDTIEEFFDSYVKAS